MNRKVLLIEDDLQMQSLISDYLKDYHFDCTSFANPKDALDEFSKNQDFCIAILDLMLPGMDGFDLFKKLKEIKDIPIIISSARGDIGNKIHGFELGVDDYLAKPFSIEELLARLRVIERRLGTHSSSVIKHNQVELDTQGHTVFVNDIEKNFSRREYMIVKSLLENVGRILSKEQLESKLYEWGEEVASNTIEVHISNIRKKLPEKFIKNVRGVGYVVSKT